MVMTVLGLQVGRPVRPADLVQDLARLLAGELVERRPWRWPACAESPGQLAAHRQQQPGRPDRVAPEQGQVPGRPGGEEDVTTVGRRRHPQALQVGHAQFDQPAEPVVVGLHLRHREAARSSEAGATNTAGAPWSSSSTATDHCRHPARLRQQSPNRPRPAPSSISAGLGWPDEPHQTPRPGSAHDRPSAVEAAVLAAGRSPERTSEMAARSHANRTSTWQLSVARA